MNKKDLKNHIIYLAIILTFLIISGPILKSMKLTSGIKYNILPYIFSCFIAFLIFGALLGAEYLYEQYRKEGVWKVRTYRAVFLGIPFTFLTLWILAYFTGILRAHLYLESEYTIFFIFVSLGYILVTCFYKDNDSNQ